MIIGHTIHGSGPEGVLVFNDWLADNTSYEPMLRYLDTATFTYAFMDLRGYGKSINIPGKHTAKEAAGDAIALADHLGWKRFHIVGYSMTGMVVQRIAIDAKDRIKSAVAIGPVSAAGVPLNDEERVFFLNTLHNDDNLRELANRITGKRLSRQWLDYKLKLARETRDMAAAADYFDMWTKTNFANEAMGVKTPFLVIVGEYDLEPFLEAKMKETFLAWHPNAELKLIRNAGHCPMQETPIYLQTIMEEFLRRHAG